MKRNALWLAMFLIGAASLLAQTGSQPATTQTTAPRVSLVNPALLKEKAPDVYRVKFTTTKGDVVIEVTRAWAPNGADRFYNLAKNGFYDGASIFRVLPGFVVQFGINARPALARAWVRATIPDDPVKQSNERGYLTFAKSGPNSRTTQVFINLVDNQSLDNMGFAPIGKVVEGIGVVERFYSGYGEKPDQSRLVNEGSAYVEKELPKLDSIKQAIIVPAATPKSVGE